MAQPSVAPARGHKTEKNRDNPENDQLELTRPAADHDQHLYARWRCQCGRVKLEAHDYWTRAFGLHSDLQIHVSTLRPALGPHTEPSSERDHFAHILSGWLPT
jgi:hypothetical protein